MSDMIGGPDMRGPQRIDPRDRAQLIESPVSPARVAALFRPHAGALSIVVAAVVAEGDLATVQNDQRVIEVYLGR